MAGFHRVELRLLPALPSVSGVQNVIVPGQATLGDPMIRPAEDSGMPFGFNLLSLIWLVGSAFILLRYMVGIVRIRSWAKQGEIFESGLSKVSTVISPKASVPMTAWIGYQVILVPDAWRTWSHDRQDAVIRHELAHIHRRDWLSQFVTRLACAALWPNPFMWILAKKARFLAERAADDAVLLSGVAHPLRPDLVGNG
jgi:beta-lactamase regulating signal transducer with metallopeptidase domain